MAGSDYVPNFLPAFQVTCTAAAAITAGQLVYVSGPYAVTPTSAATAARCGVAAQTVPSGAPVDVYFAGIHTLTASGAITAGDPVVAAASGAVADLGAGTTYSQVIGNALTTAANGQVQVFLNS
ncbi:Uncharacterised protein [Mycobacteroides abscessus subsp. abscessus]|uniref:capsid cement protein n=1 Tax=Mycobacteroides abscessus TaxID=36809 RepID=UPI00092BBC3D|nr:capsid cement protein [Mycobacteroides abscessus]SIC56312.1 Uncharacterised protein [Mycobacteroides abscessus subsp. abscessus]SKU57762.1 Uncharacterised protein [Mycobacteroides abscessus subsp. abscessus]